MMKDQPQTAAGGRGTAWLRLLGIGAAAALLALCWTAAGAAAQSEPAVTAAYEGLASEAPQYIQDQINPLLSMQEGAPGSKAITSVGWACGNLGDARPCRYLSVSWSGITPRTSAGDYYDITLTRRQIPTARDLGVTESEFADLYVPTVMSQSVPSYGAGQQYVPLPWSGEELTVTVSGAPGSEASSAVVKIPAPGRPAVLTARAAADQAGSTLVTDPDNADLPLVLSVWSKVSGVSHYELQYTFRTRSGNKQQRWTKLSYIVNPQVGGISDTGGAPRQYSTYNADWSQHPNPAVRGLTDSDFNRGTGEWLGALISLPELLAGARGWPADEPGAKAEIIAALREGKNAVGLRVRPIAACGSPYSYDSAHCVEQSLLVGGALPLWGRQSVISYVQFRGANAEEWISSAGGG